MSVGTTIPIVRIFDEKPILRIFDEVMRENYTCAFLSFDVDREQRFEGDLPLYMQVSRDD